MIPQVTDVFTGSTGIIYSAWIILCLIAGGLSMLGIIAVVNDRKGSNAAIIIILIFATGLSFIAAVLTGNLDFIDTLDNTVTYTGLWWAAWIFGAMGLIDALFVLIAGISAFQTVKLNRGY